MANAANIARTSARLASRYTSQHVARRGFRVSAQDRAAQNYTMPALSPTMTEGSIASWRIKEGESFSAGDVILEIETDKATMDVEAQDDGKLMKITMPDGSKGVKVGARIAVTAEPEDDLNSLEMPAEDTSPQQGKESADGAQADAGKEQVKEANEQGSEKQSKEEPQRPARSESSQAQSGNAQGGKAQTQKYPLYPSVEHILHQNGLSSEDAGQIAATGPQGRLLKGDVLAYLGKIEKSYPAKSSQRLAKLGHLDLSNIEIAAKAEKKAAPPKEKPAEPELPQETEIAVPISLSTVIATQKRVQDTLGIFLPLSVFIARASELANDNLPPSRNRKATTDELFDSILGLDNVASGSRGHYFPRITGVSPAPLLSRPAKKPDIIDLLTSKSSKSKALKPLHPAPTGMAAGDNIFSVVATTGEERRATEYLERMKLTLEKEPGRLVL